MPSPAVAGMPHLSGEMRLLDQVAQAVAPVVIVDAAGRHVMPGAPDCAAAVAACSLRYVLDTVVAEECRRLGAAAWPVLSRMPCMGMPATPFWVEWPEQDGRRTGLLVTGDPGGSNATVETFWEQRTGEPDRAQVRLRLMLDAVADVSAGSFTLGTGAHPLSRNAAFEVSPAWLRHFTWEGPVVARKAISRVVADVMPCAEMLCAFMALLSARSALATATVNRARLNRERVRSGKRPLLDHVVVNLDLDSPHQLSDRGRPSSRTAPRLHQVRGHLVQRGDHLFWRRSHLRGCAGHPVLSRTVNLLASRRRG